MKKFSEWLVEKHPDYIDEALLDCEIIKEGNLLRNMVAAAGIASAGLMGTHAQAAQPAKSIYNTTGQELAVRMGFDDMQKITMLEGLLKSLKAIKNARSELDDIEAREFFAYKMQDAIRHGLIPHPVDEDGEKILDLEEDEAVKTAENHLQRYLGAGRSTNKTTNKTTEKPPSTKSNLRQLPQLPSGPTSSRDLGGFE